MLKDTSSKKIMSKCIILVYNWTQSWKRDNKSLISIKLSWVISSGHYKLNTRKHLSVITFLSTHFKAGSLQRCLKCNYYYYLVELNHLLLFFYFIFNQKECFLLPPACVHFSVYAFKKISKLAAFIPQWYWSPPMTTATVPVKTTYSFKKMMIMPQTLCICLSHIVLLK